MTESLPGVLLSSEGLKDQHCSQPSSQCYHSHEGFSWPWNGSSVLAQAVAKAPGFSALGYWVEAAPGEPASPRVMEISFYQRQLHFQDLPS